MTENKGKVYHHEKPVSVVGEPGGHKALLHYSFPRHVWVCLVCIRQDLRLRDLSLQKNPTKYTFSLQTPMSKSKIKPTRSSLTLLIRINKM